MTERRRAEAKSSFKELFIKEFPLGSVVWMDSRKTEYGTTVPGRVYENEHDKYVLVSEVNGIKGNSRLWSAKRIIRKT